MRRTTVTVTCDRCGKDASPAFQFALTRPGTDGLYDRGYWAKQDLCESCAELVIDVAGLKPNEIGLLRAARRKRAAV